MIHFRANVLKFIGIIAKFRLCGSLAFFRHFPIQIYLNFVQLSMRFLDLQFLLIKINKMHVVTGEIRNKNVVDPTINHVFFYFKTRDRFKSICYVYKRESMQMYGI